MSEGKRILIIEDEIKIVEVVKSYLENSGYQVAAVHSGKDALEIFDRLNPSLVILDLMLPDVPGEEVCKALRKKSRVPILMLTARVDEESILNGFNLGADDYVTKPFSPRQIVARVAALLRRVEDDVVPLANIISFDGDDLIIDSIKHEVRKNGKVVSLTPNEYKILLTMVKYPKKAFTREELVCMALGEDYDGFDRVIDTHIKNLRQKIETNPRTPKYFLTIHGIGYRFGGE
jgi:DNA-binding response OmpR family regulator